MIVTLDTLLSRSIARMGGVHPSLKEYSLELIKRCYAEGIYVQLSSGYRSFEEQAVLFGQGRSSFRYKGKDYGNPRKPVVTNAEPGQSIHNYGLAIDYFLVSDDGKESLWTVNEKWKRVAAIAKSMGFEWGGDWKSFRDYPHLQYTSGLTLGQIGRGARPAFPKLNVAESVNVDTNADKKEGVRMFKPSTQTLENEMIKSLELAHKNGILTSDLWAQKAKAGELTLDDAVALTATIVRRTLVESK